MAGLRVGGLGLEVFGCCGIPPQCVPERFLVGNEGDEVPHILP